MSSQFDALLDFGDDPPPSTNGTTQQANGAHDFDPFGPGPLDSGKGGAGSGDGGLLLDFSVTTTESSTKNGGSSDLALASDPFDSQFMLTADTNVSNSDPFSDMSSTEPAQQQQQPSSSNPLYDLMDEDFQQQSPPASDNPLYDFSMETTNTNTNTTSDQTFESNLTTTTTLEEDESSANPLYDLMDQDQSGTTVESFSAKTEESSDLLDMDFGGGAGGDGGNSNASVEKSATPSEDIVVRANNNFVDEEEGGNDDDDQVVPEPEQESAGPAEDEEEAARSRSRSPSRHSISSEGEVINEEQDMLQDQRAVRLEQEQREERAAYDSRKDEPADAAFGVQREDDGDAVRDQDKEDFHFQEMSSVKNQFERGAAAQQQEPTPKQRQQPIDIKQEVSSAEGGIYESEPATFDPQWEDEPEEGVYENEPEQRADVVRESDRDVGAELPSVGTAKSMRDKFVTGQVENMSEQSKREVTPPEATSDGGVFENEPQYNPDVIHAGDQGQEALPEEGTAKNLAARFKEMEKKGAVPVPSPGKREITPDRTGKVEYVSEPRSHIDKYEPEVQAGVFESQPSERADVVKSDELTEEVLPEKGSAKNMAERFKQMSTEQASSAPRGKRELTPDTSGRVEFVSEPTGFVEKYEGRTESGVFESQPADREDVVKADSLPEDVMPETGTARNIAARFREMEKTTKSPPSPTKVKEFTPPRENGPSSNGGGVYESTPQVAADVVHAEDQVEEVLPEKGMAKSLADRFRQLGSSDNTPAKSPRSKKEFTPPPGGSGVYENTPKQFVPDYNKPAESGILESKPEERNDVVRGEDTVSPEQEFPERGYTKNLLSAWRQKESESSKNSPPSSGRPKEFTPPREEPRVTQQRPAPRTPKSPQAGTDMNDGSVHPTDLPGQYQPQAEASVFESEPEQRDDVVREDDTDWQQGMPKPDTTKKMLAKFKHIQQKAGSAENSPAKPKPAARKEEENMNSAKESSPDKAQNIRN